MKYNLLNEAWIPFQRRNGDVEWGPPSTLVDGASSNNPVVAFGSGRADFDGALSEFMIGLLAVAIPPTDDNDWLRRYHQPPSPSEMRDALAPLADAFNLIGDGPRFLQDISTEDFAKEAPGPIEQLLIEAAGDQTIGNNADLFIKRERFAMFSAPVAAMALLTLQTYAPGGGKGHRTSLRGGGPLTTIADPRSADGTDISPELQPLWQLLWANVPTQKTRSTGHARDMAGVFPWLAPTRTSEKDRATTVDDAVDLQVYFGMPRRIRLDVGPAGRCGMLGVESRYTATGYRARPYGVKYEGWYHPLSPYYQNKGDWLPVHGQPGGIGWRDWYAFALLDGAEDVRLAACVREFAVRRARLLDSSEFTVRAFGYDMDNMKARSWIAGSMPAFAVGDERRQLLGDVARSCTGLIDLLSSLLNGCMRRALFPTEEAKPDVSAWRAALWGGTEQPFYDLLRRLSRESQVSDKQRADMLYTFYNAAAQEARRLFAYYCPMEGTTPDRLKRSIDQRFSLEMMLRGGGKMGEKLHATIGVLPPKNPKAKRTVKSARNAK